jgi:hypothetical protein
MSYRGPIYTMTKELLDCDTVVQGYVGYLGIRSSDAVRVGAARERIPLSSRKGFRCSNASAVRSRDLARPCFR